MWYCWKCKEHVQATKFLQIYKVPPVLIISLKRFKTVKNQSRFSYGYGSSGGTDKLDTLVKFPIESLDLSKHVLSWKEGDEPLIYDLFAVSNHYGGLGGGHYTAFGKNQVTQDWYHFDDGHFRKARAEECIDPAAYNLFYRKRTTPDME
jgi:ubiquitin carboxyl-terminal hydrolase 4/11/15